MIVIACRTIEREVHAAMEACGFAGELRLIESGLHNMPKKLHARLQKELDACRNCDTVLLAMGFCGNSVVGLRAGNFQLVLPRVEDCISLLLGPAARPLDSYFLTQGWLDGERNIWCEYEYCVQKYGAELGREIFDQMFRNYRTITLLDTGCYDVAVAAAQARRIAGALSLRLCIRPGTLEALCRLLAGPWEDSRQFVIVPPHGELMVGEAQK